MNKRHPARRRLTTPTGLAAIGLVAAVIFALPVQGNAQGQGGRSPSGSPQRGGFPQGGISHARRENVRTRNPMPAPRYVPPPSIRNISPPAPTRPDFPGQRPAPSRPTIPGQRPAPLQPNFPTQRPTLPTQRPPVARYARPPVKETPQGIAQRTFTRTPQGRHYDDGMLLRHGMPVNADWQRRYFRRGRFHYPYYYPTYNAATVVVSPFAFYFGVCAPFLLRTHCHIAPPAVVYIDIPIFVGDTCQGYAPINTEDNYLDLDALRDREPGLANAVDELREAFGRGDIDALVALVDPNTQVAIFEKGQYRYSLAPNDFVDMSRDAFQSTQTIAFDLTRIYERAAGVYVVSGEHVYRDQNGDSRKVYVSYVLEDIGGDWTLTQVGTAPDRNQAW